MNSRFYLILSIFLTASVLVPAQEILSDLPSFDKMVIGPKIDLILVKGPSASIQIEFDGIDEDRINYDVSGHKLRIYLDDARYVERSIRWNDRHWPSEKEYEGVTVRATVTYQTLESLDIRGEETVEAKDLIEAETFRLRVYGEPEVRLKGVICDLFKAHLYGEPQLTISDGYAAEQIYRLYGEAVVDCVNFKADLVRTTSFGESELLVDAEDLRITAFGDASISYVGDPYIHKSIVLGDLSLVRIN